MMGIGIGVTHGRGFRICNFPPFYFDVSTMKLLIFPPRKVYTRLLIFASIDGDF